MSLNRQEKIPFLKIDEQTGDSNYSSRDGKPQKRTLSTQRIHKLNQKAIISSSKLTEKFKKQTEQLKEIKKTISQVSHSRLSQMKKIQSLKMVETDSINMYRISQPEMKGSFIKLRECKKIGGERRFFKQEVDSIKNNNDLQLNPILGTFIKQAQRLVENAQTHPLKQKPLQSKTLHQQKPSTTHQTYPDPQPNDQFTNTNNSIYNNKNSNLSLTKQSRSFSAHQIKNISNMAFTYKNSRALDVNLNQKSVREGGEMTLKERYEERLKEGKDKILKSKVRLVQSQTNFKLEKKIKENIALIDKQKTLSQLIHKRMQRQRQRSQLTKRTNQQKRFVHDSHKMKVNIQRLSKKQHQKKEKQIQRTQSQEVLLETAFKRYMKELQDVKKQELLAYKIEFMKGVDLGDVFCSRISGKSYHDYGEVNPEDECSIAMMYENDFQKGAE